MRRKPFILALLSLAWAQVNLTLSPTRAEVLLLPKEPFALTLTLRNSLPREEPLAARAVPFRLNEEGGVQDLPKENPLCASLRVVPTNLTVPPLGSAEVRLEGVAPKGEGTFACLVVFAALPRSVEAKGLLLSVRPEIAFALYVTLKGTERPALAARLSGEGKTLTLLLENPGNVLQRLFGEVVVFAQDGTVAARFPIPEVPLLPGGRRKLFFEAALPPGRYRAVAVLESPHGRYATEGAWSVP